MAAPNQFAHAEGVIQSLSMNISNDDISFIISHPQGLIALLIHRVLRISQIFPSTLFVYGTILILYSIIHFINSDYI